MVDPKEFEKRMRYLQGLVDHDLQHIHRNDTSSNEEGNEDDGNTSRENGLVNTALQSTSSSLATLKRPHQPSSGQLSSGCKNSKGNEDHMMPNAKDSSRLKTPKKRVSFANTLAIPEPQIGPKVPNIHSLSFGGISFNLNLIQKFNQQWTDLVLVGKPVEAGKKISPRKVVNFHRLISMVHPRFRNCSSEEIWKASATQISQIYAQPTFKEYFSVVFPDPAELEDAKVREKFRWIWRKIQIKTTSSDVDASKYYDFYTYFNYE